MDFTQEKPTKDIGRKTPPESDPTKIDRNAPAGSENSLGAESIRDGRPSTDDSTIEAIDEEGPDFSPPTEDTPDTNSEESWLP
jgi:hypothetical protein